MIAWTVETLDSRVDEELDALPPDMRERFVRISRLLEEFGPQHVREPYVKPLAGKLWEMRMKGKDGIARAVYVAASGRRLGSFMLSSRRLRRHRAAPSRPRHEGPRRPD